MESGHGMLDHPGSSQASRRRRMLVPALPPCLIEPIFKQFSALSPEREVNHPLGCHRPRIPKKVLFDKLVQVLVFGCPYERIAYGTCSATTFGDQRDEWIELVAVECCITKAPCGGEKAGRRVRWIEASRASNALWRWRQRVSPWAPSPPQPTATTRRSALAPTLDAVVERLGALPEGTSVNLDGG